VALKYVGKNPVFFIRELLLKALQRWSFEAKVN
jgi:hypothetical protein